MGRRQTPSLAALPHALRPLHLLGLPLRPAAAENDFGVPHWWLATALDTRGRIVSPMAIGLNHLHLQKSTGDKGSQLTRCELQPCGS